MVRVEVPYGGGAISFEVDKGRVLKIITPADVPPSPDPLAEVESAIKTPIEGPTIGELAPRGKKIAIAVDDITRVTPTSVLLSPLLKSLKEAGARKEDVTIIVALGTHRPMTDREMREKYGAEVVEEYEVVNHAFNEESGLKFVGRVAGDVPIWINKTYMEADVRIATGNIIPHSNAGWGAGAKILLPGLAGEETVGKMHVHSALTTPNGLGMEENPTRLLIDAFARKVGIHLLLNSVVTRRGEVVKAFSGDFVIAHRQGIAYAKGIYGVKTSALSDITIVSSHPADIEFWQGQKGLFSADLATKQGGSIIELTPCPEGLAVMHPRWSDYLAKSSEELMAAYRAGEIEDLIALGLALNVAHVRERHSISLISDGIKAGDVEKMGFSRFKSVEEALEEASRRHGPDSKINILTHGGDTYPILS